MVSRPNKGRSLKGKSAYLSVPAARSRNISVVAAMSKYGMFYYSIRERAVTGEDFKETLISLKNACCEKGILNPILF